MKTPFKNRKTVNDICSQFTSELELVREQSLAEVDKHAKTIAEAEQKLSQASQESSAADKAINNIRKLFS